MNVNKSKLVRGMASQRGVKFRWAEERSPSRGSHASSAVHLQVHLLSFSLLLLIQFPVARHEVCLYSYLISWAIHVLIHSNIAP